MEQLILLLKPLLVPLIGEVLARVLHKRGEDKEYLKRSDEVFSLVVSAKTEKEKLDASKELQNLLSS